MIIKQAITKEEINAVRKLFKEYKKLLNLDLAFQNFDKELLGLPGKYSPPSGALLIALNVQREVGCVAVRKLEDGICEMKRLFVRKEARGTGLGEKLARGIITVAKDLGYTLMRLDTLNSLNEAMYLYKKLGFHRAEKYYENPLSNVVYWELDLK